MVICPNGQEIQAERERRLTRASRTVGVMPALRDLEARLERAGAEMVERNGAHVPLHFGSAAGELAVCTAAVGLALRPDLPKDLEDLAHAMLVEHESDELTALCLVGPAAAKVLDAVGYDGPATPGFSLVEIGGVAGLLLVETSRRVTLIVNADRADALWLALVAAGSRFGLSYVGLEALQRFSLLDRGAARDGIATPAPVSRM